MNQASRQFNLGYNVYQKDFEWYVVTPDGETHRFSDRGTFGFSRHTYSLEQIMNVV